MAHKKDKDTQHDTDMAGPETQRTNIKYNVPVPVEGDPIYYGGTDYIKEHEHGFSHEETVKAQELARHNFDSRNVGADRAQEWSEGTPDRNKQGVAEELDNISTSAPTSNPNKNIIHDK